ncbi:MAG: substrate-binding domain-containing protein [Trueperaceae bacterium]|nr:substrate-binding domain-containing protein [Trueperaceae bacterium]
MSTTAPGSTRRSGSWLGHGHRDVAHLAGPRRDGRERLDAVRELAPRHGVRLIAVAEADFSESGGLTAGRELLDRGGFSAVLCSNDRTAVGLYAAARERGLRFPRDLSIVGFDDLPWSAYLDPALTTVRQPSREMGRVAAERILDPDASTAWQGERTLVPEPVERASVAPPTLADRRAARHDSDDRPQPVALVKEEPA